MNVCFLEESRGVTDFSPLISLEYCSIQWIPRSPPCPFHLGDPEVNCPPRPLPFPLLPSNSGSVQDTFLASRGACSCRGRLFANSTHSDMIDNRKTLRGPVDFFFKCSCRPPRLMKKCRPGRLPGSPVPKTTVAGFQPRSPLEDLAWFQPKGYLGYVLVQVAKNPTLVRGEAW